MLLLLFCVEVDGYSVFIQQSYCHPKFLSLPATVVMSIRPREVIYQMVKHRDNIAMVIGVYLKEKHNFIQ